MAVREYRQTIELGVDQLEKMKDYQLMLKDDVFEVVNENRISGILSSLGTMFSFVIIGPYATVAAATSLLLNAASALTASAKETLVNYCYYGYTSIQELIDLCRENNADAVRAEVIFYESIAEYRFVRCKEDQMTIKAIRQNGAWIEA